MWQLCSLDQVQTACDYDSKQFQQIVGPPASAMSITASTTLEDHLRELALKENPDIASSDRTLAMLLAEVEWIG